MELPLLLLRLAGTATSAFSLKLVFTVRLLFGLRAVGPIELPLLLLRLAGTDCLCLICRTPNGFLPSF
uniref:Putative secreted protein n=1 Tax=Panstrongylus lignarius TaxID=156445 RepID=A0A224XUZ0_9HEMI